VRNAAQRATDPTTLPAKKP
jgi:hypothetical protein